MASTPVALLHAFSMGLHEISRILLRCRPIPPLKDTMGLDLWKPFPPWGLSVCWQDVVCSTLPVSQAGLPEPLPPGTFSSYLHPLAGVSIDLVLEGLDFLLGDFLGPSDVLLT